MRIDGHDLFGLRPKLVKTVQIFGADAGLQSIGGTRLRQCGTASAHMGGDIVHIEVVMVGQIGQQPVEQRHIPVRCHAQMRIRQITSCRATWINVDHAHVWPRLFRCYDALVEHRMTPREV